MCDHFDHEANTCHLDHLSAFLFDFRDALARARRELGELEKSLLELLYRVVALGRCKSLELTDGVFGSVLELGNLCLRVGQIHFLMFVLPFDIFHEFAEHILHGVPQDFQEHILLRSLAQPFTVRLIQQLRVRDPRNIYPPNKLGFVESVARSTQSPAVKFKPVVLILAVGKNTEAIAEQQDPRPFLLQLTNSFLLANSVDCAESAAVVPMCLE